METRTPNRLPFHRWAVFPVLAAQCIVLLLAAVVLWQWQGVISGYSGLCGGLIAWLPNLYFAWKAFRFSGARAAQAIVKSFYAGEAGKLIITAVLFALTFAGVKPLAPLAVFGVFVLTQLVSWFAPLLMNKRLSRPKGV
ncbi:F0F1 ATP synthase subunit I [Pseudomonas entomophila]|uniref:F0F1 ATP synthase subunit I n=1 Tax=Pseudomonas entomophila TaxID=312306 RepID=UPI003EBF8D9D